MGLLDSLGTVDSQEKPKTGKRERPMVDFAGLANYAALSTIQKQIEALLKSHPIRGLARQYFVVAGRQAKRAPQNVDGRDGIEATASVQLRKRASNQPLDADAVALCTDLGIPTEKVIIAPNTMRVKPSLFAAHPELMEKLIAAGAKALGMEPAAVFELQREESKVLVCDESLNKLFGLGSNHTDDRIGEILEKLASPTVTAKFQGSLHAAFEVVRVELVPTPAEMKAREAAAATAATEATPQAGAGGNLMDSLKASMAALANEQGEADLGLSPAGGEPTARKGRSSKK